MDVRTWLIVWGSPVGIASFFTGPGVRLWGVSQLERSEAAKTELELGERRLAFERTQGK